MGEAEGVGVAAKDAGGGGVDALAEGLDVFLGGLLGGEGVGAVVDRGGGAHVFEGLRGLGRLVLADGFVEATGDEGLAFLGEPGGAGDGVRKALEILGLPGGPGGEGVGVVAQGAAGEGAAALGDVAAEVALPVEGGAGAGAQVAELLGELAGGALAVGLLGFVEGLLGAGAFGEGFGELFGFEAPGAALGGLGGLFEGFLPGGGGGFSTGIGHALAAAVHVFLELALLVAEALELALGFGAVGVGAGEAPGILQPVEFFVQVALALGEVLEAVEGFLDLAAASVGLFAGFGLGLVAGGHVFEVEVVEGGIAVVGGAGALLGEGDVEVGGEQAVEGGEGGLLGLEGRREVGAAAAFQPVEGAGHLLLCFARVTAEVGVREAVDERGGLIDGGGLRVVQGADLGGGGLGGGGLASDAPGAVENPGLEADQSHAGVSFGWAAAALVLAGDFVERAHGEKMDVAVGAAGFPVGAEVLAPGMPDDEVVGPGAEVLEPHEVGEGGPAGAGTEGRGGDLDGAADADLHDEAGGAEAEVVLDLGLEADFLQRAGAVAGGGEPGLHGRGAVRRDADAERAGGGGLVAGFVAEGDGEVAAFVEAGGRFVAGRLPRVAGEGDDAAVPGAKLHGLHRAVRADVERELGLLHGGDGAGVVDLRLGLAGVGGEAEGGVDLLDRGWIENLQGEFPAASAAEVDEVFQIPPDGRERAGEHGVLEQAGEREVGGRWRANEVDRGEGGQIRREPSGERDGAAALDLGVPGLDVEHFRDAAGGEPTGEIEGEEERDPAEGEQGGRALEDGAPAHRGRGHDIVPFSKARVVEGGVEHAALEIRETIAVAGPLADGGEEEGVEPGVGVLDAAGDGGEVGAEFFYARAAPEPAGAESEREGEGGPDARPAEPMSQGEQAGGGGRAGGPEREEMAVPAVGVLAFGDAFELEAEGGDHGVTGAGRGRGSLAARALSMNRTTVAARINHHHDFWRRSSSSRARARRSASVAGGAATVSSGRPSAWRSARPRGVISLSAGRTLTAKENRPSAVR